MKKQFAMALLVLACSVPGTTYAANPQAAAAQDQKPTFSSVFDRGLTQVEHQVVPAAEAMPDDKFNFAPPTSMGEFKGVRTFAQQVKHLAVANYAFGSSILGEKLGADKMGTGENGPDNLTSKSDIVQYLKDSFAYMHKAANTITEANVLEQVPSPFGPNKVTKLGLMTIALAHPFDHYGQMVEYLRMNNIVPPASRPKK
jgi:uncharacterized damage-inducible protein DinB